MLPDSIKNSIVSVEAMFGSQIDSMLATQTKNLSDAIGAGVTDDEAKVCGTVERKLIIAGANKGLGIK